jgi:hypothetical protein
VLRQSRFLLGSLSIVLLNLCVASARAQDATPGWNTRWRNTDGSLRDVVELGYGTNTAAGASRTLQSFGWNYRIGAGYRMNRRLAVLIEYNFDRFRASQALASLPIAYPPENYAIAYPSTIHLWSFTLEPTVQYFSTSRLGGYVIGGGGFYRKVMTGNFPGLLPGPNLSLVDSGPQGKINLFSNNAGGANFGAGFAWRVWDHSNTKLFVEGRYVWVDNSRNPLSAEYPQAAVATRTGYFPVTGGLRW